jgi:uncharacterized protein
MIFVDANIPMYLGGRDHPLRIDAAAQLERLLGEGHKLVTDAEVFQELLHRYSALKRSEKIPGAFELLLRLVDDVFPVELVDTQRAMTILMVEPRFSARDAVHIAVMEHHGVRQMLSFDKDYDAWPGITRIGQIEPHQ